MVHELRPCNTLPCLRTASPQQPVETPTVLLLCLVCLQTVTLLGACFERISFGKGFVVWGSLGQARGFSSGLSLQAKLSGWSKPCTPGEHQNRWQMDVHPPQNGVVGYAPWPHGHQHQTATPSAAMDESTLWNQLPESRALWV